MCVFCAAIPMSASLGAAMMGKQTEKRRQAEAHGNPSPPDAISVGKVTVAVTGGLIVCSAVYHLVIMPRTGAVI
jgi:hypothetical protein